MAVSNVMGIHDNHSRAGARVGFFIGQRVWSIFFGTGEVVAVLVEDDNRSYPIRVKFNGDDFSVVAFTHNGQYLSSHPDPKMDIVPCKPVEDNHASLPVEWPGPISRFLFSSETVKARVFLAYMLASAVLGGGCVAVVMQ